MASNSRDHSHTPAVFTPCLALIVCHLCVGLAAVVPSHDSKMHYIPSNAQPGHIVTVLSRGVEDKTSSVSPAVEASVRKLFALIGQGVVVTRQDISHLAGRTFSLPVSHKTPTDSWEDTITVHISDSSPSVVFEHQPYSGFVSENKPAGSVVQGLDTLGNEMKRFPYDCRFEISGNDRHLFALDLDTSGVRLITRQTLDREARSTYHLILTATCSHAEAHAMLLVHIQDENDNAPVFVSSRYTASLPHESLSPTLPVLMVSALDEDSADRVSYKMEDSSIFSVDPDTGAVTINHPEQLQPKSYSAVVYAVDEAHQQSEPAVIEVEIQEPKIHNRQRRQTRATTRPRKIFVVRFMDNRQLFSVASSPLDSREVFERQTSMPPLLTLSTNGMVSKLLGSPQWNQSTVSLDFDINVTRQGDLTFLEVQPVRMWLVDRNDYSPLFSTQPAPLSASIPVWIRPGTVIQTLQALDAQAPYSCPVNYMLQSGGKGCFEVDKKRGDIRVACRQEFLLQTVYDLSVSAQCEGAAHGLATPTQIVTVLVGEKDPQFYFDPYWVQMKETTQARNVVVRVQAKSFQLPQMQFPLSYKIQSAGLGSNNIFALNSDTGDLTLQRKLVYTKDQHLYNITVTATEKFTNKQSSVVLLVDLVAENIHTPYFPPAYYIKTAIPENQGVGSTIMEVIGIDIDPGAFGDMTFTTTDDHFRVETTDNKIGQLIVNKALDYDFQPSHLYEFDVIATDGGSPPLSGSTKVQVWVTNINDNAPVIENQDVKVKEQARQGVVVHVVQAYDADGDGISFQFGINHPSVQEYFNLDATSGRLILKKTIGASTPILFNISVTVIDNGSCCPGITSRRSTGYVVVQVLGVNHPPTFDNCMLDAPSLRENMPTKTPVYNITASDRDTGSNGQITFSVLYSDVNRRAFDIEKLGTHNSKTDGNIFSLREFNREGSVSEALKVAGKWKFPVTIKATDSGTPPLSTNCFMFVTLEDVNDMTPVFDTGTTSTTFLRGATFGERLIRVFAFDADEPQNLNTQVQYIVNDQTDCVNCFALDINTGWITRAGGALPATDREIILKVEAKDMGSPVLTSAPKTIKLSVQTNPSIRIPPVWEKNNSIAIDDINGYTIPEDITLNSELNVYLKATYGAEFLYYLTYQLGSPAELNGDNNFKGDTVNGAMVDSTLKHLDYENVNRFILLHSATAKTLDPAPRSDVRLQVLISDVNDEVPQYLGSDNDGKYPAYVTEETKPNDAVIKVTAIDLDGTSPNNRVTYSLPPVSACPDCGAFYVHQDTGMLYANQQFLREQQQSYTVTIIAKDGAPSALPNSVGPNQRTVVIVVEVIGPSMFPPFFNTSTQTVTVPEGSSWNYSIGTFVAISKDPMNYPQYAIIDGNANRRFDVDTMTGRVFVTASELLISDAASYTLTYRVFDGLKENTTTININLTPGNLYPPVFDVVSSDVSNVVENDANVPRDLVQVTAPNAQSYGLAGRLYSDNQNSFSIQQNGQVQLLAPMDRDYPAGFANWQINVVANDQNPIQPRSGYGLLNLKLQDINDNSPIFDTNVLNGTVPEHSTTGTSFMKLAATDFDIGANAVVSYHEVSMPKNSAGINIFSVDSQGNIRAQTNALDREVLDQYYAVVEARDNGSPSKSSTTTVKLIVGDINDKFPTFTPKRYNVLMPEALPYGSSVMSVFAQDNDIGDNAKLTFSVTGGGDSQYFYFDSIYAAQSGVLKIQKTIDFDAAGLRNLQFQAKVTDPNPSHSDTAFINITIYDVNDNAPIFNPSYIVANITEEAQSLKWSTVVRASDMDSGNNAKMTFSIDYANTDHDGKFLLETLDSTSAKIMVSSALDREKEAFYTIHILAVDGGTPALTGTCTLSVNVWDINDNAPNFKETYAPVVRADATKGTRVFEFQVTDADWPNNGPPFVVTYDCNDSKGPCRDFTLKMDPGGQRGWLVADRDGYQQPDVGRKFYDLNLRMKDSGGQVQVRPLSVRVESKNFNRHTAGHMDVQVFNYQGKFLDMHIGRVYCLDTDDWDLPDKEFSFYGDQVEGIILDANTGDLHMQYGLPRGTYDISVKVTDKKWNEDAICTVKIVNTYIYDDAVMSSGSMIIEDMTPDQFLFRSVKADGTFTQSKYQQLQQRLATMIGTTVAKVEIFSISDALDTDNGKKAIHVTYAASGSPYYKSSKLNGLLRQNKDQINTELGIAITQTPISPCMEINCWTGGCNNEYIVTDTPVLRGANQTMFVGVNTSYSASCECGDTSHTSDVIKCTATTCMNGGNCTDYWNGFTCDCLAGFDGGRCQQTKVTFTGAGYLWLDRITPCEDVILSLDFRTTTQNGLLLFNGPWGTGAGERSDVLSINLKGGFPEVTVNLGAGEVKFGLANKRDLLSDGNWHTIEVFKTGRRVRLVVDHCRRATITETIDASTEDSSMCEASRDVVGRDLLLDIIGPLQLGGRADNTAQPAFKGCMSNLYINGQLYDLHSGSTSQSQAVENGCKDNCNTCPTNSTCVLNPPDPIKCVCDRGLRGSNCDIETTVKDFVGPDGFIQWHLAKPQLNDSLKNDAYMLEIQLMFRTRETDGRLFIAPSFSGLERIILEVVDSHLSMTYDLGSGDETIALQYVNVSDGFWHNVTARRYGNEAILQLDHGDGKYYVQSLPVNKHRLIYLGENNVFGAADVSINKYSDQATVTDPLANSCMQDVRVQWLHWLPMDPSENSQSAMGDVVKLVNADGVCESNACLPTTCPEPFICYDFWREPACLCPPGMGLVGGICAVIVDCGMCINGDCVNKLGSLACYCWPGWIGDYCDVTGIDAGAVYAGPTVATIIVPIICLLVLLLIILLVVCLLKKRNKDYLLDVEDDDIRDNVMFYEEEGAGEEDMQGYDLSRLQKPVDPQDYNDDYDREAPFNPPEEKPIRLDHLPRSAPESMDPPRNSMRPPGDYPDIGDFIDDRMKDADDDPAAPPYDSVREYEYEGGGSSAGSLSSLQSSSSGDQDFDYLDRLGPPFRKLADLYGGNEEDD